MRRQDVRCAAAAGRYSNGAARRKLRAWLASQGLPCHLCGLPIDYSLGWYVDPRDGRRKRHPLSFEVDEIVPVSKGGSPVDRANVAPAHRICNEWRGDMDVHEARRRARLRPPSVGCLPKDLATRRRW